MPRPLARLIPALLGLAACAPVDDVPDAYAGGDEPVGVSATPLPIRPTLCEDGDGDGFGRHCEAGDDCDDQDPTRADRCETCVAPAAGCPCDFRDDPRACDVDTGGELTPATCWTGQRTCVDGAWSRCVAYAPRFR